MKQYSLIKRVLGSSSTLGLLLCFAPIWSQTVVASEWNPQLSERVLMLPPQHLERVVEQDFNLSSLAEELNAVGDDVSTKVATIQSLQDIAPQYDGEEQIEVRHQIIEGKKSYIELVGAQMSLQRQRVSTKIRLYKRLLEKSERETLKSGSIKTIAALQEQAVERSRTVQNKLQDTVIFKPSSEKSKFSVSYEENIAAIDALKESIQNHPMAQHAGLSDTGELSSKDYLRRMIQNSEAELAILDMEEEVLGHMAKLVVLDAMALADDLSASQFAEMSPNMTKRSSGPAAATEIFLR